MSKRIPVVLFVVALLFPMANRSQAIMPATPEAILEKAGMFAFGGIGVAGTMSHGERALRQILDKPQAIERLERLLTNATPAGQLYALVALRLKDRALYDHAVQRLRAIDTKVETARGCMLSQESFADLVKEIERGQYDTFLDRKWPEGT